MTEAEFQALEDWIEALVDRKIEMAFGRSSHNERVRELSFRADIIESLTKEFKHEPD